ncbi:hypothetical protein LTS18_000552, partial [Coniosporium uncinatum]
MTSSVFFKFKSSKEPQRIAFDGTGITVFELKREIITISGLGDGSDFDLSICAEDSNEEYTDDTEIIPRSSTVVARRLPAARPGHGKAARYISGKAPVLAKNAYRTEAKNAASAVQGRNLPTFNAVTNTNEPQTEQDKIAAMFSANASDWEQTKQQMANAKPVYFNNKNRKPNSAPDKELPPGYICHRCGQKGHFIRDCPTNDDPTYKGPRFKRATGIPKSRLQVLDKDAIKAKEGIEDDSQIPQGVIVLDD